MPGLRSAYSSSSLNWRCSSGSIPSTPSFLISSAMSFSYSISQVGMRAAMRSERAAMRMFLRAMSATSARYGLWPLIYLYSLMCFFSSF